ncbi:mobile element protein [Geomicrobium sp. JCM 19039]|nr:mobile element protein [Geomicrobium sp. JCM 19039]
MFVTQLTYKADWYGKQLIKVDRWFPSSQLCSSCGHHDGKKGLHVREWSCSACHAHHDRDINAAVNILQERLRTAGTAGIA